MHKSKFLISISLLTAFFLFFQKTVEANAGLPLFMLTYPSLLLALLPIILLEAFVFKRFLSMRYLQVTWRVGIANAVSTIAGVPLTWSLLFFLNLWAPLKDIHIEGAWHDILHSILFSAWLMPGSETLEFNAILRIAVFAAFIEAFFASVGIEGLILCRLFRTDRNQIWKLTWKANLLSYSILYLIAFFLFSFVD